MQRTQGKTAEKAAQAASASMYQNANNAGGNTTSANDDNVVDAEFEEKH